MPVEDALSPRSLSRALALRANMGPMSVFSILLKGLTGSVFLRTGGAGGDESDSSSSLSLSLDSSSLDSSSSSSSLDGSTFFSGGVLR